MFMTGTLLDQLLRLCFGLWIYVADLLVGLVMKPYQYYKNYKLRGAPRKCICIVGGGFGGLYTALELANTIDSCTDIYLIDPKSYFVFLPLLYEYFVRSSSLVEVAPEYATLLSGSVIKHVKGSVESIDPSNRCITISFENGECSSLPYHVLILACGTQPSIDTIPGAREHAIPFYTIDAANTLIKKVVNITRDKSIENVRMAVIGGGCGGVELAANLAEMVGKQKARISVIHRSSKLLNSAEEFNRRTAESALVDNSIRVICNSTVASVHADHVDLIDHVGETSTLPVDIVIFTAGTAPNPLVLSLPVDKNKDGRICTLPTLQCPSVPSIFALGDCCAVQGTYNPATAQVAMQQASTVAHNVIAYINHLRSAEANKRANPISLDVHVHHQPMTFRKFSFLSLGEMLTLGNMDAAITSFGGWITLSGPLAALSRRAVYCWRMPTFRQTLSAFISAVVSVTTKLLGFDAAS